MPSRLLVALSLSACSPSPRLPDGVAQYALTSPDSAGVQLARRLQVTTQAPSTLTVTYRAADHEGSVAFSSATESHDVALLGLLPDREYTLEIRLEQRDGTLEFEDRTETAALPSLWPNWELLASVPPRMEPGLTLFAFRSEGQNVEYVVVIDARGRVRWLQALQGSLREVTIPDVRFLDDGTLLATRNGEVVQTDLLGRTLNRLVPQGGTIGDGPGIEVPEVVGLFHHEVAPLPDGSGVYTLISNPFEVRGFPRSYTDPGDTRRTTIADDIVFEVEWDGTVRGAWSLAERLDTRRIGWDSLERRSGWVDWAHANAVFYDSDDDAYIVTLRHQDAVVKLSRASGDVQWVLAPHDNWNDPFSELLLDPVGADTRWAWHPHAAEVTARGSILLFDNHNYASSPLTGTPSVLPHQNTSRLVEFEIDESSGTVEQVWQFTGGADGGMFAPGMGDADRQPQTGNVLGVWGRTTHEARESLAERGLGQQGVRILEVSGNERPEVLFDLRLTSAGDELRAGWTCNRAERIPSLYPSDVATVTTLVD